MRDLVQRNRWIALGVSRWNGFWFQEIPPYGYALLRIDWGASGLVGLLGMTDLEALWWPDGLDWPATGGVERTLVQWGLGRVAGTTLYVVSLVGSVAMIVGYRSSWAVPLVFLCSLFQVSWNALPLSGAAQAYRSFLFCLLWVDTGEVWSLDSRVRRLSRGTQPGVAPRRLPIWPLRLIRFQVALIYVSSGLLKLADVSWRDGSALYYVMNGNEFRRFDLGIPATLDWVWTLGTYLTLAWELLFPVALVHPATRAIALAFGVAAHLTMWGLLELGIFSWVMLTAYLAFIDSSWLESKALDSASQEP